MFKWFDLILPPGHPSRAEGPDSSQQTSKGRDIGSAAQDEVELAEAHKAVNRLSNGELKPSTYSF